MDATLDPIHIVGYLGAIGSLGFGANQLRIILKRKETAGVSLLDYAIRVAYSVLLGIYSIGIGSALFAVVNFGAALLSLAVAVAGRTVKRENGESSENGGAKGKQTGASRGAQTAA